MKMTQEIIEQKAKEICWNTGIVSFNHSLVYALHSDVDTAPVTWFTMFDYDTPIFEVCVGKSINDSFLQISHRKYYGWKYSVSTTKHTKQAIELISMAIVKKYGKWIDTNQIFTSIDKKDVSPFYGL